MKSLRKSLTGGKDSTRPLISTPLPLPAVSKPPSSILPPQKVIRAQSAYKPQAPQELPFQKGDFFYVLKDDDTGQWYEAHNPVTGSRGLVPRQLFEEFNKNVTPIRASQAGATISRPTLSSGSSPRVSALAHHGPKPPVYYAIVQHDFVAERQDELDAKRGDAVTVVAQSNREWFVAKPIGRLGRPGLIPVSFVQIHDPTTGQPVEDVDTLIDSGDLPKVEEWKRAMINYKQNSITLGVIDSPARDSMLASPYSSPLSGSDSPSQGQTLNQDNYVSDTGPAMAEPDCLPDGILLSADVVSFHHEMDEYWFRVDAIFQPYGNEGGKLPPAKHLILFRAYNDFYDFQVSLLDTFPREAGRHPPHQRVLPYMPGPADEVNDTLTVSRRDELDIYIHDLCELNKSGYRSILEHTVVRQFLALKPGDVENVTKSRRDELEALPSSHYENDDEGELQDRFNQMKIPSNGSDGSEYEDEAYTATSQQNIKAHNQYPYHRVENERLPAHETATKPYPQRQDGHQRSGSSASFYRTYSPYHSRSRSASPQQFDTQWSDPTYQSNHAAVQNHNYTHGPTASVSSLHTSQAISSRSRSHSTAAPANLNSPPISAANPQTAFVKIKIFDKTSDDLVAIRVHPRVTHAELMGKVQARLGNGVSNLKYRGSLTNDFVGLTSDEELRIWMEGTDKHVLYAE
ncbi:hypothetical protein AX17_001211 [Amanita inopinata Kibby_2008]|nr:hypothetical protein AX17_001211 [Amanita inopinata Kibby_2008]